MLTASQSLSLALEPDPSGSTSGRRPVRIGSASPGPAKMSAGPIRPVGAVPPGGGWTDVRRAVDPDGHAWPLFETRCSACRLPLHPAILALGWASHPTCPEPRGAAMAPEMAA